MSACYQSRLSYFVFLSSFLVFSPLFSVDRRVKWLFSKLPLLSRRSVSLRHDSGGLQ